MNHQDDVSEYRILVDGEVVGALFTDDGEWVVDFGVWNTGFATLKEAEVFVETVARGVLVATSFTEAI